MGTICQSEITTIVFLLELMKKHEDREMAGGLFNLLRSWEADAFAELSKDGTVECGRYKLELTWWFESFYGCVGRRRVVLILDSASGKYLAVPDYAYLGADELPEDFNWDDHPPIQTEKAHWHKENEICKEDVTISEGAGEASQGSPANNRARRDGNAE